MPDNTIARLKLNSLKKYCFNQYSILTNYFFMNEQTRYLIFFRKFTFCRHKFSCFEHILRTLYYTAGFYLIARLGFKMIFKDKVYQIFAEFLKKWCFDNPSDKLINDVGLAVEANALIVTNLYLLRHCFYSFILEFLAD